MKVFLGWSGDTSKKVATALHDWLPKVIQSVKPYISSEDIAKGARWATEIAKELQASNYGIICITNENSHSPWINFEGGALSREIEKSYVTPFLFNLKPSEIQGPLGLFQGVMNEEADILRLLESINGKQEAEHHLEKGALKEAFEMWWPKLQEDLANIGKEEAHKPSRPKRDMHEILEELLERSRMQQREIEARWVESASRQDAFLHLQADRIAQLSDLVSTLARSVEATRAQIGAISAAFLPNSPAFYGGDDASLKAFDAFVRRTRSALAAGAQPEHPNPPDKKK